jgi:hypothetical protein
LKFHFQKAALHLEFFLHKRETSSSLFLINAREVAYIQARLKFIECTVKVQQANLTYTFALAGFY